MHDRLREIRQHYNLSMRAFADKLGMSSGAISMLENGQRNLTSQFITSVCREFNINENWLRTGQGDMLACSPADLADITAELYRCKDSMSDEELKQLEEFLKLYATMDDETRQAFYTIALNMTKK